MARDRNKVNDLYAGTDMSQPQKLEMVLLKKAKTLLKILKDEGVVPLLRRIWGRRKAFPLFFKYQKCVNEFRYNQGLDPLRIIYVNPSRINYISPFRFAHSHSAWMDIGAVKGGDWESSPDKQPIEELEVYQALQKRYEHELRWEEIPEWSNSPERGKKVDKLYRAIQSEGIKPRKQLLESDGPDPIGDERIKRNRFITSLDDVVVDIDSDGTILLRGSVHRFSIARILGLDEIPVRVAIRHKEWMKQRDLAQPNPDHPDVPS